MALRDTKLFQMPTHEDADRMGWRVDANELAADFDGSLSGLGMDLAGIPYNMNDALLALPAFQTSGGFQYVLTAPTSPATKMNSETLTYLNQGQSYELKIKRIGSYHAPQQPTSFYKSYIKVYFHERRLQYTEKEQIDTWTSARPGERILDIDSPLSYGLVDFLVEPYTLNVLEFVWDPTKDCGVFVKVNCISTEFTPKKHGGEKGVPFRMQVDTYSWKDGEQPKLLNCASCQLKVFKPKGADRKQKTDREKVEKLTQHEKEKYQPSYECTILTDVSLEHSIANQKQQQLQQSQQAKNPENIPTSIANIPAAPSPAPSACSSQLYDDNCAPHGTNLYASDAGQPNREVKPNVYSAPSSPVNAISKLSNESEVAQWLNSMRFSSYRKHFHNYSGADILALNRDELIQICGLSDGIRLSNALQSRSPRPKLTIFVHLPTESVFRAIYLNIPSTQELIEKLSTIYNVLPTTIADVCLLGANNIHILVTDEVLGNVLDNCQYDVEVLRNDASDSYRIVLSPAAGTS